MRNKIVWFISIIINFILLIFSYKDCSSLPLEQVPFGRFLNCFGLVLIISGLVLYGYFRLLEDD